MPKNTHFLFALFGQQSPSSSFNSYSTLTSLAKTVLEQPNPKQLAYYTSLIQNIRGAIIVTNLDYTIRSWNEGAELLYGWKEAEAIGKQSIDLLVTQYPDEKSRSEVLTSLQTHGEWVGEVRQKHQDGHYLWVLASIFWLYNDQGKIEGIIAHNTDITERKLAQEQLAYQARLLQQIHDAVVVMDLDFRIQSWNHGAEQLYGWTAAEAHAQLIGDLLETDFLHEITRPKLLEQLFKTNSWVGEVRQKHQNGTFIWVQISLTLLRNSMKEPIGIAEVNSNITDRKLAQQRRAELEQERAHLLHIFWNNIAHDLLTPLTTLKTSLYLLEKAPDDTKRTRHQERMGDQITKLELILQKMLNLKELETLNNSMYLKLQALPELLKNLYTDYKSHSQQFTLELDPTLPQVRFDFGTLKLALHELLRNAFNNTPPTGAISIRSYAQEPSVIIEIEDTGIGIRPHDLPYIFDRFYRADQARNTDRGGAGLGLALAKLIIEHHNGRIEVESTLGTGSLFRVYLPFSPNPA